MPSAPLIACSEPGCNARAHPRGVRCPLKLQRRRKQDTERRGNFRQRGYSTAWDKLKAALWHDPDWVLCRRCKQEGRYVPRDLLHHITPVADGGALLDLNNLEPICNRHHAIAHAELERQR